MRRKKPASKSTYRAILGVQKKRDEPSGLYVSDRFYQPAGEPKRHQFFWFSVDFLLLACLQCGLLMLLITGFSISVSPWFYPAVLLLCAGATALFCSEWCARHKFVTVSLMLLSYLLALFLCQDTFLTGLGQIGNRIVDTLNQTYDGDMSEPAAVTGGDAAEICLLLLTIPATIWFAEALFHRNSLLMAALLLFPLLILPALCGAARNTVALFLILLGIVLSMAFSKPKRQYRMWGGKDQKLREANQARFQSVQKKTTVLMLIAFLLLSVPGFFLVRPLLSVTLEPAEQVSLEMQNSLLNKFAKLLPELSAGQWNLNLKAVSGGVQDGALGGNDGYLLEGVEDLRLTLDRKPQETLFLKGYVGTIYQDGKWENHYGSTFDGAAMNWNTEGDARLYIQNLPFLRTAYALTQSGSMNDEIAAAMSELTAEPVELLVERINANEAYTYVPYGTYLNDYYEVESGDGTVTGQSVYEDRFYFFFREDMETVLSAWNALDETANVLDRVEESYRAFCETNYLMQWSGMSILQETVDDVIAQNHWSAEEDTEEITAWIRQYLAENYHYQQNPDAVPEGKDALEYFLTESKTGNSVHFASAAVTLYRMFGVPARYVVGYEIPASLFTAQANGVYTATVQGDNAQAWAEIYIPAVGWLPKDMTPGVIGTYEEIGPGGERIEAPVDSNDETEAEPQQTLPAAADADGDSVASDADVSTGNEYTVEQIVTVLLFAALVLLAVAAFGFSAWYICKTLGLDPLHRRTRQQRLLGVFRALFIRMRRLGLPREITSQSETFLIFCEQQLNQRSPEDVKLVRPSVDKLYRSCYGGEKVSEGDIRTMRHLLLAMYKRARQTQRRKP